MSKANISFDVDSYANRGKRFTKTKFETLKAGKNAYRILPSFNPSNRNFDARYTNHWIVGPEGKKMKVACTKYKEGNCPFCDEHEKALAALESAKREGASVDIINGLAITENNLRPSTEYYFNAINGANEVVVLQLKSTFGKLLIKLIVNAASDDGTDLLSLTTGSWIEIEKQGSGRESVEVRVRQTTVTLSDGKKAKMADSSPIDESLVAKLPSLVTDIHDPSKLWISQLTANELGKLLNGEVVEALLPKAKTAASSQGQQAPATSSVLNVNTTAAAQTVAAPTRTDVVAPASAPAPSAVNAASYLNEFERLQAMYSGGKK